MSAFKTLVLALVTALFCLAMFEAGSRVLYDGRHQAEFTFHSNIVYDPVLGWKGRPGAVTVDPFGEQHAINAQGLRDDDWNDKLAQAESRQARKILLIGDSLAYGLCIAKHERVGEQLEALYARQGKSAQVFNAAMPGYGTDQEYLSLLQALPLVKPDVVLVSFCENDYGDAALPYDHRDPRRRCYKPYFDSQGNPLLNQVVPKRFSVRVKDFWPRNLRLQYAVDDLQYLLDDLRYALHGVSPNRRLYGSGAPANMDQISLDPRFDDLFAANKQRIYSLFGKIRDACRAAGARLVVLSTVGPTGAHQVEFYKVLAGLGIEVVTTDKPGYPFNLSPYACVMGDGHPNYLQNALNASAVYNALENVDLAFSVAGTSWYPQVPRAVEPAGLAVNKYLFGKWQTPEPQGRWFNRSAQCLLRGEASADLERVVVDFNSARACEFHIRVDGATHTLRAPGPGEFRAVLPAPGAELHAIDLQGEPFLGHDISHNNDMRMLSFFIRRVAVEPGEGGAPGAARLGERP